MSEPLREHPASPPIQEAPYFRPLPGRPCRNCGSTSNPEFCRNCRQDLRTQEEKQRDILRALIAIGCYALALLSLAFALKSRG